MDKIALKDYPFGFYRNENGFLCYKTIFNDCINLQKGVKDSGNAKTWGENMKRTIEPVSFDCILVKKQGTWINVTQHYNGKDKICVAYKCSECCMPSEQKYTFCPHCGSYMLK